MQSETADFAPGSAASWSGRNMCVDFDSSLFPPLYGNMTLSTKPKVRNVSHCRHKRTEPRPLVTCIKHSVKFGRVIFDIRERRDKQMYCAVWRIQGTKCYMGVKTGRIHSKPRGVTSRRCGLLSNYFGHLLTVALNLDCQWCQDAASSHPQTQPDHTQCSANLCHARHNQMCSVVMGVVQIHRTKIDPSLRRNWLSQLHRHFSRQHVMHHFQNLTDPSYGPSIIHLFAKCHENPLIAFWVITLTNRQTNRKTAVKTGPCWKWRHTSVSDINWCLTSSGEWRQLKYLSQ